MFLFASLQGVGATVLIPLSSSYIDDFASKSNSPLYLGKQNFFDRKYGEKKNYDQQ